MTKTELEERLRRHERPQAWLARKLGVSRTTVNRWLADNRRREPIPAARVREIKELLP